MAQWERSPQMRGTDEVYSQLDLPNHWICRNCNRTLRGAFYEQLGLKGNPSPWGAKIECTESNDVKRCLRNNLKCAYNEPSNCWAIESSMVPSMRREMGLLHLRKRDGIKHKAHSVKQKNTNGPAVRAPNQTRANAGCIYPIEKARTLKR